MTFERIDYYKETERANIRHLVFNSTFFCAFFTAVCSFVYFYLPNSDLTNFAHVSVVAATVQEEALAKADVEQELSPASLEGISEGREAAVSSPLGAKGSISALGIYALSGNSMQARFSRGAGTASLSLMPPSVNREDLGLILYRQPQTRAAVEGFYYQVTGNRETAIAILDAAETYSIPLSLAFSLAYAESHFKPYASHVNKNGSIDRGLFQLNSNAFPNLSEEEFFDPKISALKGLKHLKYFLKTAGNEVTALAMYNAGVAKVSSNNTPHSTLDYVAAISSYRSAIEESFAKDVLAFLEEGRSNVFGEKVEYTQS